MVVHAALALRLAASRWRRLVTTSPPWPQLSVLTSSMTTNVASGSLFNTFTIRSVAPAISASFCSFVTPSSVTWMRM
jgi:hypothetical protein